jgi:hypothetical protein
MHAFGFFSPRAGRHLLALALLALAVSGCGKSAGSVSGKVFYQGKPLPGGNVNFMSEGPNSTVKTSEIKSDGSYSVSGLPVGPAKITVQGLTARRLAQLPGQGEKSDQGEQKEVFVPPQYSNAEKSGLKLDVKGGAQNLDIELK